MPDKAIDLIDEAASKLRMQQESKPEAIDVMERELIRYPPPALPLVLLPSPHPLPSLPPFLPGNRSRSRPSSGRRTRPPKLG